MKMTYQKIKAIVNEGGHPSIKLIDEAIIHQVAVVAARASSAAKHAARLEAAKFHPWPLDDDQEGRAHRRAEHLNLEMDRLFRLYFWRELAEKAPKLREANSA